jgi:hypothetical protein
MSVEKKPYHCVGPRASETGLIFLDMRRAAEALEKLI